MIVFRKTEEDEKRLAELGINPKSLEDDGADYTGKVITKPWGEEFEVAIGEDWALWKLRLEPHQETSMHCHTNKSAVLLVEYGVVQIHTLSGVVDVKEGQSVLIERGVFHKTHAPYGAMVFELEWPDPNRRDIVRLNDKYGRGNEGR